MNISNDEAVSRAQRLITAQGWRPGDKPSLHSITQLMVRFADLETSSLRALLHDMEEGHGAAIATQVMSECDEDERLAPEWARELGEPVRASELAPLLPKGYGEKVDGWQKAVTDRQRAYVEALPLRASRSRDGHE